MTARCPENFLESLSTPMSTFPEICNGLLFRSILWMCVQNLKFLALPVPETTGRVLQTFWAVPGYAHAPFLQNFNGLLFGWTLWMYRPNLQSVASPLTSSWDNWGYPKNWEVPGYAHSPHAPFSRKFLMVFYSDGPYEYSGQIWSP